MPSWRDEYHRFIPDIRRQLNPVEQTQVPLTSASEIIYPIREDNTNYIELCDSGYCVRRNNILIVQTADTVGWNNLLLWLSADRHIFWPLEGSLEFELLRNHYNNTELADSLVNEEDEMPEQRSRAAAVDQYCFTISYDPITSYYHLVPPSSLPHYSLEQHHNISDAYSNGRNYAARENSRHGSAPYRVWPRSNSTAYSKLLKAGEKGSNPSNISGFADLKRSMKNIVMYPANSAMEDVIKNILLYMCWKKYGRHFDTEKFISVRDRLKSILEKFTGESYVLTSDTSELFSHHTNTFKVHTDTDEVVTRIFSRKYFIEACVTCSTCNEHYKKNLTTSLRSQRICFSCLEQKGIYLCRECGPGAVLHNMDDGCPGYNGKPLEHIYNYSTDVRRIVPRMFDIQKGVIISAKPKEIKYGIELEVLRRDVPINVAVYEVAKTTRKYAIIKSDSSLGSDGFEVVTAPATLRFHRDKLWNDFFNNKNASGRTPSSYVKSWDTGVCGTHIHISRNALTKMQLAKLLVFYHEEGNRAFLSKIAGRAVGPEATYCRTRKKKLGIETQHSCDDHHEAVTISQRNRGKTAEVRIFRGNATKHGIMRSLEFVDAIVHWCNVAGANELSYRHFLAWFDRAETRANYPDLWKHLIQLGYLKTFHKEGGDKKQASSKPKLTALADNERVA